MNTATKKILSDTLCLSKELQDKSFEFAIDALNKYDNDKTGYIRVMAKPEYVEAMRIFCYIYNNKINKK